MITIATTEPRSFLLRAQDIAGMPMTAVTAGYISKLKESIEHNQRATGNDLSEEDREALFMLDEYRKQYSDPNANRPPWDHWIRRRIAMTNQAEVQDEESQTPTGTT